jgi:hypothetical protein
VVVDEVKGWAVAVTVALAWRSGRAHVGIQVSSRARADTDAGPFKHTCVVGVSTKLANVFAD